jgi:hypothetical protein
VAVIRDGGARVGLADDLEPLSADERLPIDGAGDFLRAVQGWLRDEPATTRAAGLAAPFAEALAAMERAIHDAPAKAPGSSLGQPASDDEDRR